MKYDTNNSHANSVARSVYSSYGGNEVTSQATATLTVPRYLPIRT